MQFEVIKMEMGGLYALLRVKLVIVSALASHLAAVPVMSAFTTLERFGRSKHSFKNSTIALSKSIVPST
jgi:hypothetical protein